MKEPRQPDSDPGAFLPSLSMTPNSVGISQEGLNGGHQSVQLTRHSKDTLGIISRLAYDGSKSYCFENMTIIRTGSESARVWQKQHPKFPSQAFWVPFLSVTVLVITGKRITSSVPDIPYSFVRLGGDSLRLKGA